MTADDWIRTSSIATLCAREEVLCSLEGLVRENQVPADLSLIFAHGTALHHIVQNDLLPKTKTLVGTWRCTHCGKVYGQSDWDYKRISDNPEALVFRPEGCGCGANEFVYVELMLRDFQYRIQGHPDGFLRFSDMPGLGVLEVKSISPKGAWEVRGCPKMDHVIQTQIYMHLTGCRWAKILYWDKGGSGVSALVEHTIDYDEDTVEKVLALITSIRDGIRLSKLPDRICAAIDCPRASECPVAEACFARDV